MIRFDRQDTKAIKGIALLMMLLVHLAGTPYLFPAGFEGFTSVIPGFVENGYLEKLALECGLLCVPFFFFLGGYGLYLRMRSSSFSLKNTIMTLYTSYWKVFFIFIPIGLLFFSRSGLHPSEYASRLSNYKGLELLLVLISDFTGLTCKLNGEWWFFIEYVCILPLGYVFCKAIDKVNDFWVEMIILFAIDTCLRSVIPVLPSLDTFKLIGDNFLYTNFLKLNTLSVSFYAGIVMAKHDGVCVIKRMVKAVPFHTILCIGGLMALLLLRMFVMGAVLDVIVCSFMIPMLSVILDAWMPAKRFFAYLGKHSTNMWLIHSFYCFYFYEFTKIVYCTQSVVLDLLILLILSLVSSILLEAFYAKACPLVRRLHNSLLAKSTVP